MKKSAPRMGLFTSATQNCWTIWWPGAKETVMSLRPKVAISVPLAAIRDWERGSVWSLGGCWDYALVGPGIHEEMSLRGVVPDGHCLGEV